jgi:hypothetical protein
MALHQLVVRVEKVLDQQERILGVFLDIEGTFNNTCYDSMCDVSVKHGCDNTTVQPTYLLIWRLLHLLKYAGYHPFTCPISCECTLIWDSK